MAVKYIGYERGGNGPRAFTGGVSTDSAAMSKAQAHADKYGTNVKVVAVTKGGYSGDYERHVGTAKSSKSFWGQQNRGGSMARKRVATGKWIAATAVRFNKDGSASIMKPKRMPNVAGYKDAYGFHPIRWDSDYDVDELSKPEPGYATDHTEPRGFFVGSRKKKKRPAARKRTTKRRRPAAKAKKRRR